MNVPNWVEVFHTAASRQQQLSCILFPMIFLTLNCYQHVSIFSGMTFVSLLLSIILIQRHLYLHPAVHHHYNESLRPLHLWTTHDQVIIYLIQNKHWLLQAISYKSSAFYNTFILPFRQETTFPRQLTWFYRGAMEPIPGDTPEPSGNIVSNYSFILTSSSRELHQAEHFIKHNISRSMTSIYWQPSLECELHLDVPSQ